MRGHPRAAEREATGEGARRAGSASRTDVNAPKNQGGVAAFVYLASRSPRRRDLLRQIGVAFEVVPADVDESASPGEEAPRLVARLARAKALAGARAVAHLREAPVLGADTVVEIDGEILGKPRDRAQAEEMLARLSGHRHRVWSAVALLDGDEVRVRVSRSEVDFRSLDARERRLYCESGEALDKAGAYALQGVGSTFVARVSGSPSGVIGLPLCETAELLRESGIDLLAPVPGRAATDSADRD